MIWTKTSLSDMRGIKKSISRDSVKFAKQFIEGFHEKVSRLSKYPEMSPLIEDNGGEYNQYNVRIKIISNYNVVYFIDNSEILIITVVHTARDRQIIKDAIREFVKLKQAGKL